MTQQPPGYTPPPPTGLPRPGELLDRFLARLVDFILLGVVNSIVVGGLIVGTLMGASVGFGGFGRGVSFAAASVYAVATTAITLGYFAYLESSRGQTVGKMLLKLKTTGPDGQNPTMEQAIRRNAFTALGILGVVPVLGLLAGPIELVAIILIAVGINNDTVNRQAWHDHFAGETRVWKVG
jgi:uncharacterized RDD family membrane protein YckC